jgi:putative NIF3 family GTP cyclohydrolase 1 type 2
LAHFVEHVAHVLPPTAQGVRAAGDPDAWIEVVAVCGGSGESFAAQADAAGADVYVTADCKHHRTLDHRAVGGCAIVDVAHWASEWLWLPQAAAVLRDDVAALGATVDVMVSTRVTDPWTLHVRSAS